jgi:hypothetical protein
LAPHNVDMLTFLAKNREIYANGEEDEDIDWLNYLNVNGDVHR